MTGLKKLPLGLQDFTEIIEGGYFYIDKTTFIHRLVTTSKLNFLSRPRRFGKSVLLSTIEALFRGSRDLFNGLYIADHWDWKPHPVIRLDLLGIESGDETILRESLNRRLDEQAAFYGLKLTASHCADRFRELILGLSERGRVVVLIDEYDKPILDHITDIERVTINRKLMANFFAVLKSVEKNLRFLFMTGVSKFTQVSLFSELNNLSDLTLHGAYAGIAGYTEEEVTRDLGPYLTQPIDGLKGNRLREKIRTWYNGYSWDGRTRVYNPVSLLSLLEQRRFGSFWFSSGTPKFLLELARVGKLKAPGMERMEISEFSLHGFEPEKIDPISLCFQTGYLTIKQVQKDDLGDTYLMGYPNLEVKRAFLTYLLADLTDEQPGQAGLLARKIGAHLANGDIDAFCRSLQSLFAAIPYNIFLADREAYYHTVIYLALSLSDIDSACEIQTHRGRVDAVIETDDNIIITEFKLGTAKEAVAQIKDRGYADAWRNRGKEIRLLGIGIDPDKRNLADWMCLSLDD
ncbi:MAG: AAA family ATPase [Acidobacteriota bacterium]|nr:AAA family ATPase [Acidobacteriota bacterium]